MGTITLVTGGARSGKSTWAEARAASLSCPTVYMATAEGLDGEMRERIVAHRECRPSAWRTVEVPIELAAAAVAEPEGSLLLIDCITLWVSNLMLADVDDATVLQRIDHLANTLRARSGPAVLVTNEVGSGIVPATILGRRYRDLLGRANQRIAAEADEVVLLVAGLSLVVKAP